MKSGFVAIVGRSNVGKSTLMNALVGRKISATSEKPQLTRHNIHGVMNTDRGQAVFVDTPGILKGTKDNLSAKLINKAKEALKGIDLILYVVDPTRSIGKEERDVYGMIRHIDTPKIMIINKMDLSEERRKYKDDYLIWEDDFDDVRLVSAIEAKNIQPVKEEIMDFLPEGEKMYPDHQLTNITKEFWVADIIREKVFKALHQEVPYSVTVEVDKIEEKEDKDMFVIEARVVTNEDHYKSMIIGEGGQKIKQIGKMARKELQYALNKKVYLDLEVEVDKHWVKNI